jgi:hypothetical protein
MLLRRRLSSHEGFPTPKIALIREKTALLFWDIPSSWPVWLSGAFSQRKITANSGRWESNLMGDRPELLIMEKKEVGKNEDDQNLNG